MAETDHLDFRVAAAQPGHSRQHRVGDLQVPGVGAKLQHVPHHVVEEAKLVGVDPERLVVHDVQAAAEAVAVPAGDLPPVPQAIVAGHQRGVDDEIGSFQRLTPVCGRHRADARAGLVRVALAEAGNGLQASLVDVHQTHGAAVQPLGEAEIPDQPQREDRAPRADDGDRWRHIPPFALSCQTRRCMRSLPAIVLLNAGDDRLPACRYFTAPSTSPRRM